MTTRTTVLRLAVSVALAAAPVAAQTPPTPAGSGASGAPIVADEAARNTDDEGDDGLASGIAAFDTAWRTIQDTYFDPAFGGVDWHQVRRELRPRVEAAASPAEQRAVIRDMLGRLGQSHFALLSTAPSAIAPRGPAVPPFDVRVTGNDELIVTRVVSRAVDVRPGDRVRAIDGTDVAALFAEVESQGAQRAEMAWRLAGRALSGEAGTRVALRIAAPDGAERDVIAVRVVPPGEVVRVGNLPPLRAYLAREQRQAANGRRVGVVRFNVWMAAVATPFAEAIDAFRDADGLIIDLRGNPGGLAEMMRGIAGHLLDEPALIGRMRMRDLDLEFRANPRRSTVDGRRVEPYAGPVAILVDELTASASECFAGGLQALGRVRIFGRRTAGQALPASTQQLLNGDVLLYAVGDFVTSDGRRLEGVGVIPDVEVPLDPAALAAGRDAEAAALAWLAVAADAGRRQ